MSGIVGIIRLDEEPARPEAIEAMLALLLRRGPDRQRSQGDGCAAFGQALLATTPEALAEIQPWQHPADGCLVVRLARRSPS